MPAPSAAADQAGERLARHHRSRRIGGAADQHALQRRLAMRRQQGLAGQRMTRLARGLDQHRLAAERGQDMPIRRIAGHRDRDAVARLEHRQKRQDEPAGRAGRDHDPLGIDRAAVSIAIMPGDPRAQRGNAERRGIIDPPAVERGLRGRDRGLRRRRRRLADFHVNDMAAGRLDAGRRRHHVHHHEGRNIAPRRGASAGALARSLSVDSSIDICYLNRRAEFRFRTGYRPRLAVFGGSL